MDAELLILNAVVLLAAVLQSATGVGFGVIAGPAFLVVMHNAAGIQVSIMLNLLIAVLLAPSLWRSANKVALKQIALGVLLGTPLGLLVFLNLNLPALKILAAVAVFVSLIMLLRSHRQRGTERPERLGERFLVGIAAGAMGGSLAMPGPVPAAWMAAKRYDKETIRATVLLLFVAAYSIALLFQYGVAGIDAESFLRTATLIPATVLGIPLGHWLSKRVSEQAFRRFLIAVLCLTIVLLLLTIGR